MERNFRGDLLEFLYEEYPGFASPGKLADFFAEKGVSEDTIVKTIAYLEERGYLQIQLEDGSLCITARGIDFMEMQVKK